MARGIIKHPAGSPWPSCGKLQQTNRLHRGDRRTFQSGVSLQGAGHQHSTLKKKEKGYNECLNTICPLNKWMTSNVTEWRHPTLFQDDWNIPAELCQLIQEKGKLRVVWLSFVLAYCTSSHVSQADGAKEDRVRICMRQEAPVGGVRLVCLTLSDSQGAEAPSVRGKRLMSFIDHMCVGNNKEVTCK